MPRFSLGQTVATPAALEALQEAGVAPLTLLARHLWGDWGDLDEHDRQANEDALTSGARIFSAYQLKLELRVWVITDAADGQGRRAATTVLLPSDY